jgi:hypothetical protein
MQKVGKTIWFRPDLLHGGGESLLEDILSGRLFGVVEFLEVFVNAQFGVTFSEPDVHFPHQKSGIFGGWQEPALTKTGKRSKSPARVAMDLFGKHSLIRAMLQQVGNFLCIIL